MTQNINPATGRGFCEAPATPMTSLSEVTAALDAAAAAFPAWAATPAAQRARSLHRLAHLLRERNTELATMETLDTGRPITETSTVDVASGADVVEFYANLVGSGGLDGDTVRLRDTAWVYTRKEPLGVCVGIGAWNYPLQIALWKAAPCLAAGNVMVYKPSEFTPLHANKLAGLMAEAGLPPGVFTPVFGDGLVGAHLTQHPRVAKVSFTGQVATGVKVAMAAASQLKYTTMELGGKSPLLVLPDVDLDDAVAGAMNANFFSSGQVCTNGTRVFVPAHMLQAFEARLLEHMRHVRIGDPLDPHTNFGPLVSGVHLDKVRGYIQHGIEVDKARLVAGGLGQPDVVDDFRDGFWVLPTVFSDCRDDMLIVKDEVFGPVMCLLPYASVEEAIERANATPMGLAAGVFTRDIDQAHQVVAKLQAGITWINSWGESPAEMSVGGWKSSGLGVENGRRGLEAWVRNKSTLLDHGGVVPAFAP